MSKAISSGGGTPSSITRRRTNDDNVVVVSFVGICTLLLPLPGLRSTSSCDSAINISNQLYAATDVAAANDGRRRRVARTLASRKGPFPRRLTRQLDILLPRRACIRVCLTPKGDRQTKCSAPVFHSLLLEWIQKGDNYDVGRLSKK